MPSRRTRRQQPELTDEQKAAQGKALEARAVQLLKAADVAEELAKAEPTPAHQAMALSARQSADAVGAMAAKPARSRRGS